MSDHIKTCFKALDDKIDGFRRGTIAIVANRPAMGKSTFAQNLSYGIASQGESVLLFSLDMSESEATIRILSTTTNIDAWKVKTGTLTDADIAEIEEKKKELEKIPLYIDDSSTTFDQLQAVIKQRVKDDNIDLVIVDYLQQIEASDSDDTAQTSNDILHKLQKLAKELNVAIVVFARLPRTQPNKNDPRPTVDDLSEYIDGINELGTILFLHRPDYYRMVGDDFTPTNIVEVIIYQQPQDKPEIAELYFHPEFLCFMDKPDTMSPNS